MVNKNIVWAYDDLQTIFNIYTRTPKDLFGNDENDLPTQKISENIKKHVEELL